MLNVEQITDWLGQEVRDSRDESLGKLEDVYYDQADQAQLALVKHGSSAANMRSCHWRARPSVGSMCASDTAPSKWSTERCRRHGSGAQIDGMVAQQLAQAFGEQMPAEDLQSATALQQRREEARDAEENAARLEAEAREQAEDAKSAQARADERSGDAADAQQAALRAREESDQLKP